MPLRIFRCPVCGYEVQSLSKHTPKCIHEGKAAETYCKAVEMEEVLSAPSSKMMEKTDQYRGKSKIKDQGKILKARAREHARDYEAKDLVDFNRRNGIEKSGFLKPNGKLRGKIDDK